jgi:hypothetical protein
VCIKAAARRRKFRIKFDNELAIFSLTSKMSQQVVDTSAPSFFGSGAATKKTKVNPIKIYECADAVKIGDSGHVFARVRFWRRRPWVDIRRYQPDSMRPNFFTPDSGSAFLSLRQFESLVASGPKILDLLKQYDGTAMPPSNNWTTAATQTDEAYAEPAAKKMTFAPPPPPPPRAIPNYSPWPTTMTAHGSISNKTTNNNNSQVCDVVDNSAPWSDFTTWHDGAATKQQPSTLMASVKQAEKVAADNALSDFIEAFAKQFGEQYGGECSKSSK